MMVCLQSVWFKFKSALKGICAAFFPLRMKCKLKSLNRRYFAWYIQLNDFCKLSANTTAVLHVFLACWVSVHLMLHEVLLSFFSLICHYEGIHTSSPKRRRFPVANNRWSCAFDVTRSPAFILFFNLSLRMNSHFLTLEKTFSSGQQSASNMRSNVIVQSGCPSERSWAVSALEGFLADMDDSMRSQFTDIVKMGCAVTALVRIWWNLGTNCFLVHRHFWKSWSCPYAKLCSSVSSGFVIYYCCRLFSKI